MPIFSPKTSTETEVFTADFTRKLPQGVTLLSGSVSISVLEGTDGAATSRLSGAAFVGQNRQGVAGKVLCQKIAGGVNGVRYMLKFTGAASDGTAPEILGDFVVKDSVD